MVAVRVPRPPRLLNHMTTYAYYLLRIHGSESWDEWGDDWLAHADVVGIPSQRSVSREWLRSRVELTELDWGATLYELTEADLRHLPDGSFFEASFVPGGRYGVAVVELY